MSVLASVNVFLIVFVVNGRCVFCGRWGRCYGKFSSVKVIQAVAMAKFTSFQAFFVEPIELECVAWISTRFCVHYLAVVIWTGQSWPRTASMTALVTGRLIRIAALTVDKNRRTNCLDSLTFSLIVFCVFNRFLLMSLIEVTQFFFFREIWKLIKFYYLAWLVEGKLTVPKIVVLIKSFRDSVLKSFGTIKRMRANLGGVFLDFGGKGVMKTI